MELRLSKLMSERGICSRREADSFIEKGQVLVDDDVVSELGTKVSRDVTIKLLEAAKAQQMQKVTILLNKPIGFVSTQPEKGYLPAIDLITPEHQFDEGKRARRLERAHTFKLSVAGRLDIDSKGLLVLTQDGVIAKQLTCENADMEKEYLVRIEGKITREIVLQLQFGLKLEEELLKPVKIDILETNLLRFTLKQSKKRQIRRMCDLIGLHVIGIKRVRVGGVKLGKLPLGSWRFLRPCEQF
ncbi:MAG: rRNA pseudouridine synthase [Simkaniaceae bacterium]|nr:rRNA pseudouridine synthase [Simkaniaceae bacterium]